MPTPQASGSGTTYRSNPRLHSGHTQPVGVAVVVEAAHMCMQMRGIQKQNSVYHHICLHGRLSNPR